MVLIDLTKVTDGLHSLWWNRIRCSDFAFFSKIFNCDKAELNEGDVLIHKEKHFGDPYPLIKYAIIEQGQLYFLDKKSITSKLQKSVVKYIMEHNILPFNCRFVKSFKNGNVEVKYEPTKYDSFTFRFENDDLDYDKSDFGDIGELLKQLDTAPDPLPKANTNDIQNDIEPITYNSFLYPKVYVENAKIEKINKRESSMKGKTSIFYLLQINGGKYYVSATNKDIARTNNSICNVRIGVIIFNESKIVIGDYISFHATIFEDKELGYLLQNIREIQKQSN